MSSPTDITPPDPDTTKQADVLVVDKTDWKAEARKWETRAKENTAAAEELAKVKQAQMSNEERLAAQLTEAEKRATTATADALRFRVAAKHGITDDDADLFLTGTDADTLERQAKRLLERTPTAPRPDPSQGAHGIPANGSPEQDFANFLGSQLRPRG